jgi:hypothetical protein
MPVSLTPERYSICLGDARGTEKRWRDEQTRRPGSHAIRGTEKRWPQNKTANPYRRPWCAGAVFLSYASDDAAAAERIATTLRKSPQEKGAAPRGMKW